MVGKTIILFRCHTAPNLCSERVRRLKNKNPTCDIYGVGESIFSSTEENYLFEEFYVPSLSNRECWLHGDLVLKEWFTNIGKQIEFDQLVLVEWDAIVTVPFSSIFPHFNDRCISFCDYKPHPQHTQSWLSGRSSEIMYLTEYFEDHFDSSIKQPYSVGYLPLAVFPKMFLEQYSKIDQLQIGNDELKLSLASQASGIPVKSIPVNEATFNVERNEISLQTLEDFNEKLYHPVRSELPF